MGLINDIHEAHGLIDKKKMSVEQIQDLVSASSSGYGMVGEGAYGSQSYLDKIYEKLILVYRCINFIATNLAQLPIRVKKVKPDSDDFIDVTDRPEFQILQAPNPYQSRYDFYMESFARLEIQGELFWEINRAKNSNKVMSIYADWQSDEVTIKPDAQNFIAFFQREINGKVFTIDPQNVFMAKYFNPNSHYRGMSPLKAGHSTLNLELDAIDVNSNLFKQGLKLSGILETQDQINETETQRLRKKFESLYTGVDKMHKVAVLTNGLTFKPLQNISLSDAEFMNLRQFNREELAMLYGIMLEVLGIGKNTYENIRYARKMVWTETLMPKMNKILGLLNRFFLPNLTADPTIQIYTTYKDIEALKEDKNEQIKRYVMGAKYKAVSPNEIRQDVFGKNPWSDSQYDEPIESPAMGGASAQVANKNTKLTFRNAELTYDDRTKLWVKSVKKIDNYEKWFLGKIRKYLDEQVDQIRRNIEASKSFTENNYNKQLIESTEIFNLEYWNGKLQEEGKTWITSIVSTSAQEVMNALEAGVFDPLTPSVRQAIGQRLLAFSNINSTTKKKVQEYLREAYEANLSTEQAAKEVSDHLAEINTSRARLIARTETYGAANLGTQEGMVQAKVQRKMWLTSRDAKVRDSHQIDGQVVKVDQNFILADGSMMPYPMDYNERCVHTPTSEEVNI